MNENNFSSGVLILLVCLIFLPVMPALAIDELPVYYYDRPPYRIKVSETEVSGLMIDITKLVFQNAEIACTFIEIPFKRMLETLKEPVPACFPGILRTECRNELYLFSDSVFQNEPLMVFINRHSIDKLSKTPTMEEILTSHLKLGVVDGYSYGAWYDEKIRQYHSDYETISYGKAEWEIEVQNIAAMIMDRRVDYTFMSPVEISWIYGINPAIKASTKNVQIADAPEGNHRYIVFSKAVGQETVNQVNRAIKKVINSDEYVTIINNYK